MSFIYTLIISAQGGRPAAAAALGAAAFFAGLAAAGFAAALVDLVALVVEALEAAAARGIVAIRISGGGEGEPGLVAGEKGSGVGEKGDDNVESAPLFIQTRACNTT